MRKVQTWKLMAMSDELFKMSESLPEIASFMVQLGEKQFEGPDQWRKY